MENSEQLFVARVPKNVTNIKAYFKREVRCSFYVLTRAIIAGLTS